MSLARHNIVLKTITPSFAAKKSIIRGQTIYHRGGVRQRFLTYFWNEVLGFFSSTMGHLLFFLRCWGNSFFIDREARQIMHLVASIRPSICVFVCLCSHSFAECSKEQ